MTIPEISEKCGLDNREKKVFEEFISNQFFDRWKIIYDFAKEYSSAEAINKYICPNRKVNFRHLELLEIEIYTFFAGEIPIIYVPDAYDFETLVTNAIYKDVCPELLPQTGASFGKYSQDLLFFRQSRTTIYHHQNWDLMKMN